MIRACARSQRRVIACRALQQRAELGIKGKARSSLFFVEPGSSRTKPPAKSTCAHVSGKTSERCTSGRNARTSRCRGPIVREGGRADNGGSVNWVFVPSMLR